MTDSEWDTLYAEHIKTDARDGQPAAESPSNRAGAVISNCDPEDLAWLISALQAPDRRWFVVSALQNSTALPEALFEPLIQASIKLPDPSSPKWLIEPLMWFCGRQRVNKRLIDILEHGSDSDKIGASQSLYWAGGEVGRPGVQEEPMDDLNQQIRSLLLRTFIDCENVELRREVLSLLNLDPDKHSLTDRALINKAIIIAQNHPDDYIRHRIGVQLGETKLLYPLPARKTD